MILWDFYDSWLCMCFVMIPVSCDNSVILRLTSASFTSSLPSPQTNKAGEEITVRRRWRLPSVFRRRRRTKSVDSERVPSGQSAPACQAQPCVLKPPLSAGPLPLDWDFDSPPRRTPSLALTEDRFTAGSGGESDTLAHSDDAEDGVSLRKGILVRQLIRVTDRGVQTDSLAESGRTGNGEESVVGELLTLFDLAHQEGSVDKAKVKAHTEINVIDLVQ